MQRASGTLGAWVPVEAPAECGSRTGRREPPSRIHAFACGGPNAIRTEFQLGSRLPHSYGVVALSGAVKNPMRLKHGAVILAEQAEARRLGAAWLATSYTSGVLCELRNLLDCFHFAE